MKEIKTVTEGLPSGYKIVVRAMFGYDEWDEVDVVVVESTLTYGDEIVQACRSRVYKPLSFKRFFKKMSPKITWKEKCENKVEEHIEYLTAIAKDKVYREEITNGLFESLEKVTANE